jgi:tetratricopeptide (TPR) repeat protein
MTVAELVEEGIRAYTRGDRVAAARRWREALAIDPRNERTLSYLALLEPRTASPVALPGPPAERDPFAPEPEAGSPRLTLEDYAPAPRPDRSTLDDYTPSPWDQEPAAAAPVVISEGDGLDLASLEEQSGLSALVPHASPVTAAAAASEVEVWMQGARELFALGDFSGSLELIERILKVAPAHAEAREYLAHNESTLIAMYESKLGPPGAIPRLAISPEEVTWLSLDHRAGFLLAQIDGTVSYEDLFALSGLPRLDTARILANLLAEGVIR